MTILITGATGNVGSEVFRLLKEKGEDIRLASRNPEAAGFPAGTETAAMDLNKPETLAPALKGIKKVFLYTQPEGIDGFVREAIKAGIEKVVVLSSLSASFVSESPGLISNRHIAVEKAIEGSGLNWCFLRPGAFATNSLNLAKQIKFQGKVSTPYPLSETAPIHEKDIAEIGVKALSGSELDRSKPLLTGPESLTQKRLVEIIGAAAGKEIIIEEISPEEARIQMVKYMAPQFVDVMLEYQAKSNGKPAFISPEFEKIMGKPGRTFAEWAKDHAADFMKY
jgi:uncharacterized protein YbjT (DUF2867 family)